MSRLTRPVQAETPFAMALTTSFVQRSPQRFCVTLAESESASRRQTSLARSVTRPCTSPTRNTVWPAPLLPEARRTWPGSQSSTVIELAIEPSVLPQPTMPAIVSSLMQFCRETTKAPGARYWRRYESLSISERYTALRSQASGLYCDSAPQTVYDSSWLPFQRESRAPVPRNGRKWCHRQASPP